MKGRDEEEETPLLPTIREQKAQTARKQKWQAGSINKLLPRKKMNTITRRAPVKLPNAPSLSLSQNPKCRCRCRCPRRTHIQSSYVFSSSCHKFRATQQRARNSPGSSLGNLSPSLSLSSPATHSVTHIAVAPNDEHLLNHCLAVSTAA